MVQVTGDGNWPVLTDDPTPANPTTGTDLKKSTFEDASLSIAAAIDGQCHAPGADYQATRPREITVEVIDARGTADTLSDRLDVALAPDGTPLNQTPPSSVRNGFVLGNVLANDTFPMWSKGPTLAPDHWALSGAGALIQQCGAGPIGDGIVMTEFGEQDHFAARLTCVTDPAVLSQVVNPVGIGVLFGDRIGAIPRDANGDVIEGYVAEQVQAWAVGGISPNASGIARMRIHDNATGQFVSSEYAPAGSFVFMVAGPLELQTDGAGQYVAQCRVETPGFAHFQCIAMGFAAFPPMWLPGRVRSVVYQFPVIGTPTVANGYGYFRPGKPFHAIACAGEVLGAVPTGGTTLKLDLKTPVGGAFVSLFNTVPAFVASDRHLFKEVDTAAANYRRRTIRGNYAAGGAANLADNSVLRLDVTAQDSGATARDVLVTVIGFEYDPPFNQFRIGSDLLEA